MAWGFFLSFPLPLGLRTQREEEMDSKRGLYLVIGVDARFVSDKKHNVSLEPKKFELRVRFEKTWAKEEELVTTAFPSEKSTGAGT